MSGGDTQIASLKHEKNYTVEVSSRYLKNMKDVINLSPPWGIRIREHRTRDAEEAYLLLELHLG